MRNTKGFEYSDKDPESNKTQINSEVKNSHQGDEALEVKSMKEKQSQGDQDRTIKDCGESFVKLAS